MAYASQTLQLICYCSSETRVSLPRLKGNASLPQIFVTPLTTRKWWSSTVLDRMAASSHRWTCSPPSSTRSDIESLQYYLFHTLVLWIMNYSRPNVLGKTFIHRRKCQLEGVVNVMRRLRQNTKLICRSGPRTAPSCLLCFESYLAGPYTLKHNISTTEQCFVGILCEKVKKVQKGMCELNQIN